jgi:EAL domain-containing protein (putative c-di-GMP-specific phosphodiesterase class I)
MTQTTMSADFLAHARNPGDHRRQHSGVQCAACSVDPPEIVVQTEIASSAQKGCPLGVMCVGINRFSDLLDSMGRGSAEQLLKYVNRLLTECVGDRGIVLRISEDRFLALLRGLDTAAITDVASDILQLFSRAHEIQGCRTAISANIGVAMYPKDGSDGSNLITSAKVALNHARACGCMECRFYTEHMKQAALKRATLEADMLRALELRQFSVHYQPKVSVSSGALRGAEALLRWNCPQRGWVSPAEFIPIAEESGLILPLGEWVLAEVCRQARQWRVQNGLSVAMAVNMSPIQLRVGKTVALLRDMLQRHDMPPDFLELEVTESSLMQDNEAVVQELRALTQQGVRIAIDDFGIGYSNLSRLGRLPVSALKVDRSLITDIGVRKCDRAIVRAVIAMARELGASVVAEGVEKDEQLAVLRAIGCSECQGYLIARPMAPDAFIQWTRGRGLPSL